jgi:hypothetical protein
MNKDKQKVAGETRVAFRTPNVCVSDGPADGNENKSSAEGPFAARNG